MTDLRGILPRNGDSMHELQDVRDDGDVGCGALDIIYADFFSRESLRLAIRPSGFLSALLAWYSFSAAVQLHLASHGRDTATANN